MVDEAEAYAATVARAVTADLGRGAQAGDEPDDYGPAESGDQEALAFGVGAVALAAAPLVLAAVKAALHVVLDAVGQEATATVRDRVKAFFGRSNKPDARWQATRKAALQAALAAGASAEQAALIADATVGALVTGA